MHSVDPVVSSSNIPTIPLTVAQAMNPSPRPPSPTARAATQRAHRRDNPNQLTSRDAQVLLMGASTKDKPNGGQTSERPRIESFFTSETASTASQEPATLVTKKPSMSKSSAPPRPSREIRRKFSTGSQSADVSYRVLFCVWCSSYRSLEHRRRRCLGRVGQLALAREPEDHGRVRLPMYRACAAPSGRRHQGQARLSASTRQRVPNKSHRRSPRRPLPSFRLPPGQRREDGYCQYQRHQARQAREDRPTHTRHARMGGQAESHCPLTRVASHRGRLGVHGRAHPVLRHLSCSPSRYTSDIYMFIRCRDLGRFSLTLPHG